MEEWTLDRARALFATIQSEERTETRIELYVNKLFRFSLDALGLSSRSPYNESKHAFPSMKTWESLIERLRTIGTATIPIARFSSCIVAKQTDRLPRRHASLRLTPRPRVFHGLWRLLSSRSLERYQGYAPASNWTCSCRTFEPFRERSTTKRCDRVGANRGVLPDSCAPRRWLHVRQQLRLRSWHSHRPHARTPRAPRDRTHSTSQPGTCEASWIDGRNENQSSSNV